MSFLRNFELDDCENLDAGVFSGDLLEDMRRLQEFEIYVNRWRRAITAKLATVGEDPRSVVELDLYSLEALRLLYRGAELLLADISMEDHPQPLRIELHNYHSYLRAILQSLGDEVL